MTFIIKPLIIINILITAIIIRTQLVLINRKQKSDSSASVG